MKLEEIKNILIKNFRDDRVDFKESWLSEMPGYAGTLDTFPSLLIIINDFLKNGIEKISLGNNIYKIVSDNICYYWISYENRPALIVEIEIKHEVCQVKMTGKKTEMFGKPPYASELYAAIIKDNIKSLLISDEYLTDSSVAVWVKLLKNGKKISVYDVKSAELISIESEEELKSYYYPTGNRFRFAISRSALKECHINASFRLYRFRRDNNIL